jgi:drug/metabolite transporter (DMT)-like permease
MQRPADNVAGHGVILIHLHCAALLLGGTALFSKLIALPAVDIISYRALVCGGLVLAIAAALRQQLWFKSLRRMTLIFFCSLLFSVHWSAYFHAMQVSTVAIGIVSMFSFPVMTVFIEPLFNAKRVETYDVFMGMLVLFGVALMVPTLDLSNNITQGVLFGLLSAIAVALRNVLVTRFLAGTSPLVLMAYHGFISSLVLMPFASTGFSSLGGTEWLLIVLLASLFTAVPHTQITFGLLNWPAKKVSMIVSLQVVYAAIFAWVLLSEALTWQSALGGAFILFAAMGESLKKAS